MAIIAFESQNIIDSTTVGRELITAADEAAARAAIGVDLSEFAYVDADNTFTGDNDFSQGITGTTGVFSGNVTALKYFGDGSALTNLPGGNPFDQSLNTTDSPSFVGGSFSGDLTSEVGGAYKLYNLGDESAADSEFGLIGWDTNSFNIGLGATGTGSTSRPFNLKTDSTFAVKTVSGTSKFSVSTSRVIAALDLIPNSDGARQCGRDGARWSKVNSVDGSFSGDLTSEVGGAFKVYNLGSEGDADTEYFDITWQGNNLKLKSQSTGAGVERRLDFEGTASRFISAGITICDIGSGDLRLYSGRTIRPLLDNQASVGKTGQRFTNVYSYNGNFSGNMTLSGLPTSDPGVAGELWNDSGTVKVSI